MPDPDEILAQLFRSHANDHKPPTSKAVLASLPQTVVSEAWLAAAADEGGSSSVCSLCLTEYVIGDTVVTLPCTSGHCFHYDQNSCSNKETECKGVNLLLDI